MSGEYRKGGRQKLGSIFSLISKTTWLNHSVTLILHCFLQDEWASVAHEVMAVYKWSWVLFVIFVVMTAFVVVNLLIAVICDAVHVLRTAERAMLLGCDVQLDGDDKIPKHIVRNVEVSADEQIEKKINELQRMLDEMVETQECMAMTIEYLSLALIPTFSYESTEYSEEYSDNGSSFDAFNEYQVDRY